MNYSRLFADISANNSTWNARDYRNAGHILVAIKATEGVNYVNPYHRNWCLHAGLNWVSVVHYHFARPDLGHSPEAEAAHFLDVALPLAGWWDYLALDFEEFVSGPIVDTAPWVRDFDRYIHAHTRFRTILYASRHVLQQSDQWLVSDRRRVWDADWSNNPDFAPPGYECVFRQFTDGVIGPQPHALPGVGDSDVNRMSSSMFADLTKRYRH